MATLILTTVGSALGGPIGGALGGLLGNAIDHRLFKPKGRDGPRLTELKVQTSSYGTPIPRLYGTMRVAGTVIWATDLKETRTKSGGGKGQPGTTTYSYSASFAVLLSARPVRSVGRIWADGKLLRGAAGDWKATTGFRLHTGGEDQAPDPLIAAAEGAALAPAMRGQAYAVFEHLQLAEYGNRIPSLTFEVVADDGPVGAGTIAAELARSANLQAEGPGTALDGFSAYGDSVRGVLETLAEIDGGWFATAAGRVSMRSGRDGDVAWLTDEGAGAGDPGTVNARTRRSGESAPRRIALAHYDPARDYQAGLQRARRPGVGGIELRIDLPAALSADAARTLAAAALARAEAGVERRTLTLAPHGIALTVGPGDRIEIAGEDGRWRVARWTLEKMVVRVELARIAAGTLAVIGASGRVSAAPDQVHGPTILHAFEIPPTDDSVLTMPRLTVAAAGGPGWRQAALLQSRDGGASWIAAGAATVPATLGAIRVGPGPVGGVGTLEVTLANDAMELADADDAALDAGANLALAGDELLQFGSATRIAPGRWRLSRLRRGRRGTEWATGAQYPGDRFVLIEADAMVLLDQPLATLGTELRVLASGVGDLTGPAEAAVTMDGRSIAPPAPTNLRLDGDTLRWTRRSRAGWGWPDGTEPPLVEEAERYRVTLAKREVITTTPELTLTVADRVAGGVAQIRQVGTFAESRPATIVVPQ